MDLEERKAILKDINSDENKARKAESLRQFEIFKDRQKKYVVEYLKTQFSEKTVKEMPIVSSINLARKCIKSEASIYKTSPERMYEKFSNEKQAEALYDMYNDNGWDAKFLQANEYFKLQQQVHLMWGIRKGEIKPRVMLGHHLDVIPDPEDPEVGAVYIISTFNKRDYIKATDGVDQKIADTDDFKKSLERYVVWSGEYNFTMDGHGKIISEEIDNPLRDAEGNGVIPIIDIAGSKDNEYWIRSEESVTDFSVQFNGSVSDVKNVVRMQGWGQAVVKGPKELMSEEFQIGLNKVIHLVIDPNNPAETSFEYVTANPDLMGSLEFLKALISMFLSSRGLDSDEIKFDGTAKSFSSGIERLLAMIEKFEASKSDLDLFEKAEKQSFDILRALINTYSNTGVLNKKWDIGEIPKDAYITIKFAEPQMIETEDEKLARIEKKMNMGLMSRVKAYMELWEVDEDTAVKELAEIDAEKKARGPRDVTPPPPKQIAVKNDPKDEDEVDGKGQGANA